MRALKIGGWTNLAIAATHVIGLIWAWSFFRWVGIEHEMRELARQSAALPYVVTLLTAAFFLAFALYALSGAGVLRRLPLLRSVLVFVATIYLVRATILGGIGSVLHGDIAQIAFAAIALFIGLCYASGAVAYWRQQRATSQRRSTPKLAGTVTSR